MVPRFAPAGPILPIVPQFTPAHPTLPSSTLAVPQVDLDDYNTNMRRPLAWVESIGTLIPWVEHPSAWIESLENPDHDDPEILVENALVTTGNETVREEEYLQLLRGDKAELLEKQEELDKEQEELDKKKDEVNEDLDDLNKEIKEAIMAV